MIQQSEPVGQHLSRVAAVAHPRMPEASRASSKKAVAERRKKRRKKKVKAAVPMPGQLRRRRDLRIGRSLRMKEVRIRTRTTHAPTSSVTSS